MTGWLEGRRALVVGAGSGIGRAVVDAFLAEGAQVAVLEKDAAKCAALSKDLPNVPVVTGDATTQADNEAAVRAALDQDHQRGSSEKRSRMTLLSTRTVIRGSLP